MAQRDTFIRIIHEAAKSDRDIVFISADFGAPALDAFREQLPRQFIHAGISEQNMINVATGLALEGKKVYCYAMSPFFLRCFEQMKLAALMECNICIISVGGGLGYAGSGPTQYALEDIPMYRTLGPMFMASDETLAEEIAKESLILKGFKTARLERQDGRHYDRLELYKGYARLDGSENLIVTYGYLVDYFRRKGHSVIDVFRLPVSPQALNELAQYDNIYTFEEQYLPGGFGAAIVEALADYGKKTRVFRRGVPQRAIYENGKRDDLLKGFWE